MYLKQIRYVYQRNAPLDGRSPIITTEALTKMYNETAMPSLAAPEFVKFCKCFSL